MSGALKPTTGRRVRASAYNRVRERRLPPPRGAQSRPARGRAAHGGARAHRRRRGLRQDPRAHAPDRAPDPRGGRVAREHPGDHLHEQGVAGDGGARRGPAGRRGSPPACGSSPSTPPAPGCCDASTITWACRASFTIYDDGDTERLIGQVLEGPRPGSEALPASRRWRRRSDGRRTRCCRPTSSPSTPTTTTRRPSRRSTPRTSSASARPGRSTSTTSSWRRVRLLRDTPRSCVTTRSGSATS